MPTRTAQNWILSKKIVPKWLTFTRFLTLQDALLTMPSTKQETHASKHRSTLGTLFEMIINQILFIKYEHRVLGPLKHTVHNPSDN